MVQRNFSVWNRINGSIGAAFRTVVKKTQWIVQQLDTSLVLCVFVIVSI